MALNFFFQTCSALLALHVVTNIRGLKEIKSDSAYTNNGTKFQVKCPYFIQIQCQHSSVSLMASCASATVTIRSCTQARNLKLNKIQLISNVAFQTLNTLSAKNNQIHN